MSNLHQYVPTVKYVEDCFIPSTGVTAQVSKASLHPIIIGWVQLTAARARGAKKAKLHGKMSSLGVSFTDFILSIARVAAMMWHDTTNTKKSSHELKSFDGFVTTLVRFTLFLS